MGFKLMPVTPDDPQIAENFVKQLQAHPCIGRLVANGKDPKKELNS